MAHLTVDPNPTTPRDSNTKCAYRGSANRSTSLKSAYPIDLPKQTANLSISRKLVVSESTMHSEFLITYAYSTQWKTNKDQLAASTSTIERTTKAKNDSILVTHSPSRSNRLMPHKLRGLRHPLRLGAGLRVDGRRWSTPHRNAGSPSSHPQTCRRWLSTRNTRSGSKRDVHIELRLGCTDAGV